jgi:membrane protease YdiL (CAAX protease family)
MQNSLNEIKLTRKKLVFSLAVTTILLALASFLVLLVPRVNILTYFKELMSGFPTTPLVFFLIVFVPSVAVGIEWILLRYVPRQYWFEPINDQLAKNFSLFELSLIFIVGSISEEIFFRGVLQNFFGFWIATLLFVVIHTRYLKRFVLLAVSIMFGCGLGLVYLVSNKIWVAILCHFLLNMGSIMVLKKGSAQKRKIKK